MLDVTLAIHQLNNFVGVEHAAWKIVIGDRKIATQIVEFKSRTDTDFTDVPVAEAIAKVRALLAK